MKFIVKPRRIFVELWTKIVFKDKKPFIDFSIWDRKPNGGIVRTPKEIATLATKLVADAQASGYTLKIEDIPCKESFGMGHTETRITVSNSYEHMRAIMDSDSVEVLPDYPPTNLYNILVHPTDTDIVIDFNNGPAQYLRPVGTPRRIKLHTKNWPVMTADEPGYNHLMLVIEGGGSYDIQFNSATHQYFFYNSTVPVLGSGKDAVILKSRGLRAVYVEPGWSNIQ